jgi:hypothetical protein
MLSVLASRCWQSPLGQRCCCRGRYLWGAGETIRLGIAEAFVTCTDEASGGAAAPGADARECIVQQRAIPFLQTVAIRADQPSGTPSGAAGDDPRDSSVDVQLDLWVPAGMGDPVRTSTTGLHSDVMLRRCHTDETLVQPVHSGSSKTFVLPVGSAPMEVHALVSRTLKPSKRLSTAGAITLSQPSSGSGTQVQCLHRGCLNPG